jgi:hypothetical protein
VGGFVPVDAQKGDKNVEFGESWFMRKWGRNGEIGVMGMKGGPTEAMGGCVVMFGGWPEVLWW